MKLASLKTGGRDGSLIVVSRNLAHFVAATDIATTLQIALDDWQQSAPRLNALYAELNEGTSSGIQDLDVEALAAPLPRAFEFVDGSAYLPHVERVPLDLVGLRDRGQAPAQRRGLEGRRAGGEIEPDDRRRRRHRRHAVLGAPGGEVPPVRAIGPPRVLRLRLTGVVDGPLGNVGQGGGDQALGRRRRDQAGCGPACYLGGHASIPLFLPPVNGPFRSDNHPLSEPI